jgi:ABC-type multidrug transport system fused ATPase/permease subunit
MKQILYFIKRLFSFSGKILYVNIIGMSLISVLEGIGIILLIPMLSISGIVDVGEGNTILSKLSIFPQQLPKSIGLPIILLIYILLVLGQNLIQKNLTIRNVKIIQRFIHHLRIETYRLLLEANWEFYTKKRKSDLVNLLTTELGRVSGGINQFLQLLTASIFTIIQITFALMLSFQMTVFVLISGILLALFSKRFIKTSKLLGRKTSLLSQEYLAGITDQLNGIKDIKSNSLEESRIGWLRNLTEKMFEEQVEFIKLKTASQLFYKLSSAILIAIFIFTSVKMFNAQPEYFLVVIVIFSRLWPRITGIQNSLEQIASTVPAFKSLIKMEVECKESSETIDNSKNLIPLNIENEIECQNVSFRYNKYESKYALQDINLHFPSNLMTAIVGRSGAGKSTLIDILMGLNRPEIGNILIDGKVLTNENILALRRSISYVPQDPFLFNASVKENLLLIEPNASEKDIWDALEFSMAADFVKNLPNGLDTTIGDRGLRLSGGERQRLILARAILRKPSILILDEATSALDTENETKIQEALEKLKGKMTIIVIAHRLSTIRNADQVVVLDRGTVIQKGGFLQLAEKRGIFSTLLGKQIEAAQ